MGMAKKEKIRVFANRSGQYMGERICRALAKKKAKSKLEMPAVQEFAVGESKVILKDSVRSNTAYLVQSPIDKYTGRSIHDNLMETMMTINALRGCDVSKVVLIMPCLPYSRQDTRFGREPCTAAMLAQQFSQIGVNHLITVDLHADQIKEFYNMQGVQADGLYASPILLRYISRNYDRNNLVILSPDAGGLKRALFYANKLGVKAAVASKSRSQKEVNKIDEIFLLGDVENRDVIIIDDMVDTAGTVSLVIDKMIVKGARSVSICCAHPLLSHPAISRLDKLFRQGKLRRLITTDSIYYPTDFNRMHPWFVQLSLAPLFAEVIMAIHKKESISKFYL